MPETVSPLVRKSVKCPACYTEHKQPYFRRNIVIPEEREGDQHVTKYSWPRDNIERIHPPYYFILYCPHCHFADTVEDFSNPYKTDFGPNIMKYFKRTMDAPGPVQGALVANISYDAIDFATALRLHALALHHQLLPPESLQDMYKIARLYLRIAWLYREAAPREGDAPDTATDESRASRAGDGAEDIGRQLAQQARATLEAFEAAFRKAKLQALRAGQALDKRMRDIEPRLSGQENPYAAPRQQLERGVSEINAALTALLDLSEADAAGRLFTEAADPAQSASDAEDVHAAFRVLKDAWEGLPLDEEEATRQAVAYFKRALDTDARLSDAEKQYSVISVLTYLESRLGEPDAALGEVHVLYQNLAQTRQELIQRSQQPGMDPIQKETVNGRVKRLTNTLEKAAELREELLATLIELHAETVQALVRENPGIASETLEGMLRERGIHPDVVQRMKRKGMLN